MIAQRPTLCNGGFFAEYVSIVVVVMVECAVFIFYLLEEMFVHHEGNGISGSNEQKVEQLAVHSKKIPVYIGNCENDMPMLCIDGNGIYI